MVGEFDKQKYTKCAEKWSKVKISKWKVFRPDRSFVPD